MSSCSEISSEIAALAADIAALSGKFATKSDLDKYLLKEEKPQIVQEAFSVSKSYADPKFALLENDFDGLRLLLEGIAAGLIFIRTILDGVKQALDSFAAWVRAEFPKLQQYVDTEIKKIYDEIARQKGKDYESELAELRQLIAQANGNANNAKSEAKDARTIAEKAYELAQATSNELLKFKGAMQTALEGLRAEFKRDIAYVTERALAAMQRLEGLIRSEIENLTNSTRAALLRLQGRLDIIEPVARVASSNAIQAVNKATRAQGTADQANGKADKAARDANSAVLKANDAINKATKAIGDAQNVNRRLDEFVSSVIAKIAELLAYAAGIKREAFQYTDSAIAAFEARLQNNAVSAAISKAIAEARKDNNDLENKNQYKMDKLANELDAKFKQGIEDSNFKLFQGKDPFADLNRIAEKTAKLNQDFDALATLQFKASQGDKTAAAEAERRLNEKLGTLGDKVTNLDKTIKDTPAPTIDPKVNDEIADLKRRLGEREQVDKQYAPLLPAINAKLDQLIPTIAGIPIVVGNIPNTIRPMIPTIPQIGSIVQETVCNPQCQLPSVNAGNNATNAANKANSKLDNLGKGVDATVQAAQTALLTKIDGKLGAEIVGGISGKLTSLSEWLHLDRVLNIMTTAATIHNAFMLSNDIGQTLLGVINNGIQLLGIKDDKGSPIDVGAMINSSVENFIKGLVGIGNYSTIKADWAKANRIYQASTNVLNNFMNISQVILQANELIGSNTGKIGNALKKGGVIMEKAYGWMNPQPKFNRVTKTLENLGEAASTVQMISQIPLDAVNAVAELNNSATEFVKAVKEDDKPENKAAAQPEPDELKAKESAAKTASQPLSFDFSDLFDGED